MLARCRLLTKPRFLPQSARLPVQTRLNSSKPKLHAPRQNVIGVFSPVSALLFVGTGVALYYYFEHEKKSHLEAKEKEMRENKQYGRPNVGGPFQLTTHDGKTFTEKDLLGKWNFVYFGFTNCPDICPAELDKVGAVMDSIQKVHPKTKFQPVFISVDPARDTPSQIQTYLQDFHPSFIGLVGSYADTKSVCKAYRVYFSTPPNADPKGDYLVDHSIFIYMMDPDGKFVEAFGQSKTVEEVVEKVNEEVLRWEKEHR